MTTMAELKNYQTLIATAQAQHAQGKKLRIVKTPYQKAVDAQAKKQREINEWYNKKGRASQIEKLLRQCKKTGNYKTITEAQLQLWAEVEAQQNGWLCFHDKDSRLNPPGYPDLTIAKAGHPTIWIELKKEGEKVKPGSKQEEWLEALSYNNSHVYTLEPRHWEFIRSLLQEPTTDDVEVAA